MRLGVVDGCSRTEAGRLVGCCTVVLNSLVDSRWQGKPEERYRRDKEEGQTVEDLQRC